MADNQHGLEQVERSEILTEGRHQNRLDLSQYVFSPKAAATLSSQPTSNSWSAVTAGKQAISTRPTQTPMRTVPPSPRRKPRSTSTGYVSPSTYAHLPGLKDSLSPNLICIFIGLNPGLRTAATGHAYAHPSNLFWKLLHSSGCTPRRCQPSEDVDLPRLYSLGNTNIVTRPTRNGGELKKEELDAGVSVLEEKIRRFRPEAVCIVGKSIWESIQRTRYGKSPGKPEFRYGWQDETERMGIARGKDANWEGSKVFVACSTSGLAANLKPAQKETIWRELGIWIQEKRITRQKPSGD